jgi:hypothetical protein
MSAPLSIKSPGKEAEERGNPEPIESKNRPTRRPKSAPRARFGNYNGRKPYPVTGVPHSSPTEGGRRSTNKSRKRRSRRSRRYTR